MVNPARFLRTVRYLKPQQVLARVMLRFNRPNVPSISALPARTRTGKWKTPARRRPSMTGKGAFRFLNEDGSLRAHGWDGDQKSKLWRYNQHYFDDLNAADGPQRRAWHEHLLCNWVGENPPVCGVGWEPYPTSLRIVNWIKWILTTREPRDDLHASLAIQTGWLSQRIEWHLLGNHLFANAKGLVFAGLFFNGTEADRWLITGLKILRDELPEQILMDGAQFELSPMYHALALEDVLDLVNISRAFGRDDLAREFADRIPAMVEWLLDMSHPDGDFAFFNDAAIGIAPSNDELLRYAQDLGFAIKPPANELAHHVQSGYVRMEREAAVVIADLACIGPDYLPGHAHADTLSFEFSLHGKRFVVNSGTSEYGTGLERLRQRGSAAHSTLVLDGENSSEVWSGFRVGRRAKTFDVAIYRDETSLFAHGAHDGYTHLSGGPVHRRKWCLSEGRLVVEDAIEGCGVHQVEANFHLGGGITAVADTENGVVELGDIESGRQVKFSAKGGSVEVMPSSWHPEFGLRIETLKIRVSSSRSLPCYLRYEFSWAMR